MPETAELLECLECGRRWRRRDGRAPCIFCSSDCVREYPRRRDLIEVEEPWQTNTAARRPPA